MSESSEEHGRAEPPAIDSYDVPAHLYQRLASAATVLIATGTLVYHWLEDWSWVDAFYFSVVAATTVGFGDLSPSTDGSKLFTVAYIIIGVAVIAAYLDARFKKAATRHAARSGS